MNEHEDPKANRNINPMKNSPIRPQSLAEIVADRLKAAILRRELALGEALSEEKIAAAMEVSRTPVREALNQLQQLGLVAVKPQRGSYVFEASEADVQALCEFRMLIEPRAAELAFRHAREDTIAEVQAAIAEMTASRKSKDGVRYSRADTRLHEAFVLHCGNSYLQAAYATAGAKIAALRTHLSAPADVLRPAGYEQHQQLLAHFSTGDFAAFDALMRVHVAGTRENYMASLKARRAATV